MTRNWPVFWARNRQNKLLLFMPSLVSVVVPNRELYFSFCRTSAFWRMTNFPKWRYFLYCLIHRFVFHAVNKSMFVCLTDFRTVSKIWVVYDGEKVPEVSTIHEDVLPGMRRPLVISLSPEHPWRWWSEMWHGEVTFWGNVLGGAQAQALAGAERVLSHVILAYIYPGGYRH